MVEQKNLLVFGLVSIRYLIDVLDPYEPSRAIVLLGRAWQQICTFFFFFKLRFSVKNYCKTPKVKVSVRSFNYVYV